MFFTPKADHPETGLHRPDRDRLLHAPRAICFPGRHVPWFILVFFTVTAVPQFAFGQLLVAHRGASAAAPENTLAAFHLAWKLGADAIEGDFYLTRDKRIVTIHDKTTKRTANRDLVVKNSTLAELRALDFGSWKSPEFAGTRIPTLTDVLAAVPPGKKIFIEIKCGPEVVPFLRDVLSAATLRPSQTVVIAFDSKVIAAVKQQIPAIKAYWLVGYRRDQKTGRWTPTPNEVLATLQRTHADGLDTQDNREVVTKTFVKTLRDHGYGIHVWTVDAPETARYYQQLGIDSITTNRPDVLRKNLKRHHAVGAN